MSAIAVKIENPADFRKFAELFNVPCGTGKGRLPSKTLATTIKVLVGQGMATFEPTTYFDGSGSVNRQGSTASVTPKAAYAVSARVPRRDADGSIKRSKAEKVIYLPGTRKALLTSEQIRALTDAGDRGRLSDSNALLAAAKHSEWLRGDELADVTGLLTEWSVNRVDANTVNAKPKAAKPRPSKPKAVEPATAVADTVVVDLDKVAA
jgi:hypothetical protein